MSVKHLLLVEGSDDEHVVKGICGRLKLGEIEKIQPLGGIDELLKVISTQTKDGSAIATLGIIVDADTDLAARWQQVADRLKEKGYCEIGGLPDREGVILMPPAGSLEQPKVGIWVMPDNQSTGCLEDFLQSLISQGDKLHPHAKQIVAALPEKRFLNSNEPEDSAFNQIHQSKAIMHTWLAWQEKPGRPFGQSITAEYLDPNLPPGQAFAAWLRKLFFEE